MNLKTLLFLTAALTLQSIAFSQTNPLFRYLPDNATMVMSFNPVQLAKRVPGEAFRQSAMYRELTKKDEGGELKAFFSDPSISGIDFTNDLLLIAMNDSTNKSSGSSVQIFGLIKNETLFSLAMKKLSKGKDSLHVYGMDKIFFSENGGSTMAWNNQVFVINTGNKQMKTEISRALSDTTGGADSQKLINELKYKIQKEQRDLCFYLLSSRPGNSLMSNTRFAEFMNTAGDIKIWNSGTAPNPVFGKIPQLAMFSKLQAFTGKNKTTIINFENGKITAQNRSYLDGAVAEVYKKYPRQVINNDLTRRLPKGKLLLLMNLSFNTEMGKELMEKTGFSELMTKAKEKIPFDLSNIQGAFKNNVMMAVIKSDEVAPSDSVTNKMNGIQVFLAMPIADKAKFEALRSTAKLVMDSLQGSEFGGKMLKGFSPYVKYNDELFVLSLSPEAATAFLNNTGSGMAPEWLQPYSQHPMVMSINIKELLAMAMGKKSKGNSGESEKKVLDMFDQLVFYGGDFENESLRTTMEFKFSDPNTNALKQLFDMINVLADGSKKINK